MSVLLDRSLILRMEHAESNVDVLKQMCDHLCKKGIVKDAYCQAILEREKNFPTGLNTGGINTVIPHADVYHVNTARLCVTVLNPPIGFRAMDEPDDAVPISLITILVLTEPHGHLEMFQGVVGLIQNQEEVKNIITVDDKAEIEAIIRKHLLEAE